MKAWQKKWQFLRKLTNTKTNYGIEECYDIIHAGQAKEHLQSVLESETKSDLEIQINKYFKRVSISSWISISSILLTIILSFDLLILI